MKRFILSLATLAAICITSAAQVCPTDDFSPVYPALDSLVHRHFRTRGCLRFSSVVQNGSTLDFHFTESVSNLPLRPGDSKFLAETICGLLPEKYASCSVGALIYRGEDIESLAIRQPQDDGRTGKSSLSVRDRRGEQLVKSTPNYSKGLSGRHIAMWQSHGYYYNDDLGHWTWQRPALFETIEDIYTQSYVIPFLAPMLENAGANVLIPRERDYHSFELIMDNDLSCTADQRSHGRMSLEKAAKWEKVPGFADSFPSYTNGQNPFNMGTACVIPSTGSRTEATQVCWKGNIPQMGEYAVYVTYPKMKKACKAVKYTVHCAGYDKAVTVNQQMGAGSWVYLGTYEFAGGEHGLVSLTTLSSSRGSIGADAVKIGGGMGCIARGDSLCQHTSSMPRFAEGARYFLQWSGYPENIWNGEPLSDGVKNDYRDDLVSRGEWVSYLTGSSWVNPKAEGLSIPVDLSLAFHTDAGKRPDSETVGTLAIYTLYSRNSTSLPSGASRKTCRELADYVQTQVVNDIRAQWDTLWTRRMLWNRSYNEARTTSVPALLFELLSHENFEDMKFGLDPMFRFSVCRAIYKAILKYLSLHYGCPYQVQPLPVRDFSAKLELRKGQPVALLRWKETVDTLEPTAVASSFIVRSRIDDCGWDGGKEMKIKAVNGVYTAVMPVRAGSVCSFRIIAANAGGRSFPSEVLSVGIPSEKRNYDTMDKVLVINNFTRVSGPTWLDFPTYGGFDSRSDNGVPWGVDWSFIGEQTEFNRTIPFDVSSSTGFGASQCIFADKIVSGNTFDYVSVHGKSILKAGCCFESCSGLAFGRDSTLIEGCGTLDLICGKECTVRTATRTPLRGGVFTRGTREAVLRATSSGKNIIVSGAYIASDVFSSIYPLWDKVGDSGAPGTMADRSERMEAQNFIRNTLGYTLCSSKGSRSGCVESPAGSHKGGVPSASFPVAPNDDIYCVESPDAIRPSGHNGYVFLQYKDTRLPAAVRAGMDSYAVAAFGFPLETIADETARDVIIAETLDYFKVWK